MTMATFPDTPATLLARIAVEATGHADETAWLRLFELYAPAIQKFAAGLGAQSDTEDVAQEIFIKLVNVLRNGAYRADAGKFRCYLAAMIRRELVSRWRKAQSRGAADNIPLEGLDVGDEPAVPPEQAAIIDAKWRLARHEAAVEHALTKTALSARSCAIYRAYVLEELPIDQVAERFGVTKNHIGQIKLRIGRMIAALEAEYAD